ncbi:hypothetical protein M501DRAFT_441195 [Patellaria atrata CBS 101060]|uniref:Uncharacterized protein n=1 Tax=Patellaria atrata CBS 101060 TaxID=1346257 RepID=A0A9P4VLH5_9PEZI|nr:hypothetical protein M501DRAFT_441195 [Patellaria atrata CBS 101060]
MREQFPNQFEGSSSNVNTHKSIQTDTSSVEGNPPLLSIEISNRVALEVPAIEALAALPDPYSLVDEFRPQVPAVYLSLSPATASDALRAEGGPDDPRTSITPSTRSGYRLQLDNAVDVRHEQKHLRQQHLHGPYHKEMIARIDQGLIALRIDGLVRDLVLRNYSCIGLHPNVRYLQELSTTGTSRLVTPKSAEPCRRT